MNNTIKSVKADGTVAKRLGKVLISHSILFGDFGVTSKILSNMVVIETKKRRDKVIEYIGFSPMFDVVEDGQLIPTYLVQVDTKSDTILFIKGGK